MEVSVDEVLEIDRESFQLAYQVFEDISKSQEHRPRATALLEKLVMFSSANRGKSDADALDLGEIVSEAMLDLKFVLDPSTRISSFRLAPFHRYKKAGIKIDLERRPKFDARGT